MPVRVSLPSGVTLTAIAAGYESGYAIGSDSHLYAWGANSDGELGDGTTTNADTPVQVSLPTGVTATAIAGGNSTAYAIGSNGKLCAWGENNDGQLGNGTTSSSDTPVLVSLPPGSTPLTLGSMKLSQSAFAILATEPLPTTQVLVPRTGAHLFGLTFLDASAKHASSVEFRLFGGSYGYAAPVICTAEATIFGWLCL